jgi:hypothetical protein
MAIIFLFNMIVVRKSEVLAKYPGGLAQFRLDWMPKPRRWREDHHLLAYSSMGGVKEEVVDRLRALGVDVLTTTELVPPAENVKRCPWLDWDICERIERMLPDGSIQFHDVPRHWLRGTEPGETLDFRPQPKV